MMRVALTLEQCWHRVPGGTAVAALGMARALRSHEDLDLVGVTARHRAPPPREFAPPIAVRHLPLPRVLMYESWHRWRKPQVERATGPVDVVHATTLAIPPRSVPLVLTLHDLLFLKHPEHFTPRGLKFFEAGLRLAVKDVDVVMCSSTATLEHCKEVGFDTGKLRLVHQGVDLAPAPDDEAARVRAKYELAGRFVLWVGTIEPRKNLPALLRAWKGVKTDAELVLVGPRGWNEDLDQLIRGAERVRALGFVDGLDLPGLYKASSVFVFPSLLEGFGLPVLEAMAQGTPVITSKGTSTEELAGDSAVLIEPRDEVAIRDAVSRVLDDDVLARKLAEGGPSRAAEFPWERSARLVHEVYREVVG